MPELSWYGHSCFKLDLHEGGSIVFDPYQKGSVPGAELPDGVSADRVCCSHEHHDHNAADRIALTGKTPAFTLTVLDSYHDDAAGGKRGLNRITVVEYKGFRAVHMGDQGCLPTDAQLQKLQGADLLLLPVGGCFTIEPQEAKELLERIRPRVAVPMHYRRGEMGYPVLKTLEDFTAQFESCVEVPGSTLEITDTMSGLYVLKL